MARRSQSKPSADPYRDTDVIDCAARFAQAVTGIVALLGAVFGWPLAWALMSGQLLLGLTAGRWACLPCLAYFELVQPRFGEGPLEDSRPPRLANAIGTVVLGSAAITWWVGAPLVGTVLASVVAALALLSASTGLCVGCEVYRLGARLRGISPRRHDGSTRPISAASTGTVRRTSSSRIRCAPSAASGSGGSEAASRRF